MSAPLICERDDDVKHVGTFQRLDGEDDIELVFIPAGEVWIKSERFTRMKERLIECFDASAIWDNTGKIIIHLKPESYIEHKISKIKKLVSWTYKALLEQEASEDDLMQVAPGIWMLESDIGLAQLDKESWEKLDQALAEIFGEKPKKLFISTPEI